MAKEKQSYFQEKIGKWVDMLTEKRKKGKTIEMDEIGTVLYVAPVLADCVNDLDMRIRKLEQLMKPKFEDFLQYPHKDEIRKALKAQKVSETSTSK
jgi:hypothetical protein